MKLFSPLYARVMTWAAHIHAPRYLAALSFAESSFFPIPPDVMLAPMTAAKPHRGMHFALITTVASVLGGLFGYLIGWLAFDAISPWLMTTHHWDKFLHAKDWFQQYGVWVIFVAGFSPIPYKLFTICAGSLSLALMPFLIGSFLGRGGRFFLVAGAMMWLGPKFEPKIRQYVEIIGWTFVVLLVVAILLWQISR